MKVLMFGWEFPPHISGGLGTACQGLTKGLLYNDVDVTFVVPKMFGDEDTSRFRLISANGFPVRDYSASLHLLEQKLQYLAVESPVLPYLTPDEYQRYTIEGWHNVSQYPNSFNAGFELTGHYGRNLISEVWKYAIVASEIAQTVDFDIIHAHDWLAYPAGILAKQVSGRPLVVHVHATEFDRSGENINQQVYDIEREGMHAADKVVAVSELTRQIVINRYGINPEKVIAIHNGVEQTAEQRKNSKQKKFGEHIVSYLGRVTYQKGPEYFVEAAAKVLQKSKNYRFVMAGSGDMLHRMIKLAAAKRISSHFHFTGFLKGKEVDDLFAMSDVYVMPSVSEPFGISPLEAVRAGVPVIVSKQSGVREVLKHAAQVDFWDTDAMANAIFALTRYNGLNKHFTRNSKHELQTLTWESQASKIKDLYQTLMTKTL